MDELTNLFSICNTRNSEDEYTFLFCICKKLNEKNGNLDEIYNLVNLYLNKINFEFTIHRSLEQNQNQINIKKELLFIKQCIENNNLIQIPDLALSTFSKMLNLIDNSSDYFQKK